MSYALGRLLLTVCLTVAPLCSAFAFGTVASVSGGSGCLEYRASHASSPPAYHATPAAACSALSTAIATANAGNGYSYSGVVQGDGSCRVVATLTSNGSQSTATTAAIASRSTTCPATCPANSTGTSSCTCNDGFKPNTGATACVASNCAAAVAYLDLMASSAMESSGLSTTQCYDGCNITGDMASQAADGKYYLYGPYRTDGGYCNGGGDGKTVEPAGAPSACVKPQCPGTVNGTAGCYPCGTTATETKENAQSVNTSASGASSPGGSTSTSQQTICVNGSCTTTTTTTVTNIDGSKTTTTTSGDKPTTDMGGFCKENPGSPICKNSSFGGACAGGFQCDGDAVQCAIAKDQHARNCAFFDAETPQRTTFENAVAAGTDAAAAIAGSESSAFAFPSAGNTTAVGPASGCIGDKSVSIMGHSASIPLSQMCGSAGIVGNALVVLATLIGAFICFRPKAA